MTILGVFAHPDDAELWAGGVLAKHAQSEQVTILVASTDEVRRHEAAEGARLLGVNLELVNNHSVDVCARFLLALNPKIVITHPLCDVHPDHRHTAEILLAAVPKVAIETGYPHRMYTCDSYESLTLNGKIPGIVIVDVTETFEVKRQALSKHHSQPLAHFIGMAERLGASWGGRIGCPWAEAFDPVPVLGRLPGVTHL
jgi:LmbE family N-acetylglucosaminyl deacetylase